MRLRQFMLFFLGFAAVSGIAIYGYTQANPRGGISGNNSFALGSSTIVLFAIVLAVAVVFSWAYVWLARMFPKAFIWVTGILNIVFALATAIYMLYNKYWSGGIVFLIFGLFLAFCFYTWIPRIPFSALMLTTAIDVSKNYGHVYMVSWLGGLTGAAFAAWYAVTLVAVYNRWEPSDANPNCRNSSCSSGTVTGLIVFITFTMYWISEVLKNIIHVTISGVYGSWYFCVNNFPGGATRGALKRAMTYSFGSICFGSLIVAIINFLRHMCSVARSQAAADGDMISYILFCILGCLISLLDWAVTLFNRYAFSHIALYGKAYIPAAKDTWSMIKDRGIDALVNVRILAPIPCASGPLADVVITGLSHRPRALLRRHLHRLRLRPPGLRLPLHHRSRVQPGRRLHARHHRLLLPHRPADRQCLHHAHFERHRHHLRRCRLGPRGHDPAAPPAVRGHGAGVPPGAAGYPCVILRRHDFNGRKHDTRGSERTLRVLSSTIVITSLSCCQAHLHAS
jgi:hypothetical protein